MIGMMLEHDFMIRESICDTFVLTKRGFPGSDQALLNTLGLVSLRGVGLLCGLRTGKINHRVWGVCWGVLCSDGCCGVLLPR